MAVVRRNRNRLYTLGVGLSALACGGGTQPPGPPAALVISGGNTQSWYFNNPLPTSLSVTAQDASGRAVPGVVVTWTVTSGSGGVNPAQSTTNASGVAATTDSISSTIQTVSATFTGLVSPVSFTAHATTPPAVDSVDIAHIAFNPESVVVQVNGTVTWNWRDGSIQHNVTYTAAPPPLPASSPPDQTTGTFSTTFLQVGTYRYRCTRHAQMNNGVVTVVH